MPDPNQTRIDYKSCGMNTPLAREMPFRWYRQPAISCRELTVNKHTSIYYWFIVRFPIGLDFLFITFTILLHLLLSWTSSLSISSSAISDSTLSNHGFLGLPTGLLPSTLYTIHFFTQSSSPFLITCPYHLSLPLLMKVMIGSTPTSLLNSSFVLLSFNEIPHIHLIICISALSNFNPTSTSKGLVSLGPQLDQLPGLSHHIVYT